MSTPGITRHSEKEHLGSKRRRSRAQAKSPWSSLVLLLLLGGLAEMGLGRASLAQANGTAGIEQPIEQQTLEPVVIDPAATIENIDAAVTAPELPTTAPTTLDETVDIVVPKSQTNAEELEEAEPDAIAPPAVETQTVDADLSVPEPSLPLETKTTESIPTESIDPAEEASPTTPEAVEETEKVEETETTETTETTESEAAERVYLAEDKISFIPPAGFTAMSMEEIKTKFPRDMPPQYAYANEARDVSVGITVSDIPLAAEQLPEVKAVLEDFLEDSVPGFQWLEHDFVNLSGQDWIKLEFISQTLDQQIHNDMYITSLQGKLLGFNFNANLAVDFALRDRLQDSRNSIQLDQTVASDK